MGISIADNFNYQGAKPLDARISFDSVAAMKAQPDATLYDGCFAYEKTTDKYYKWLSTNEEDETYGKWRVQNTSADVISYADLSNKPSINGVTLSGNKTTSDFGFSYEDLTNKPDIPSNTSDLTNDSDYITSSDLPTNVSELTNDSGYITASDLPTATSDLTNDSGFITENDLPTSTSELVNDSGFITNAVNNLVNYYLKSETYTKAEVEAIATAIKNSRFELVNELPTEDIKTNVIYLVPKNPAQTDNVKDEYINLDGTSEGWEKIGDTEIDLSDYVTTSALNTTLADYVTTTNLNLVLASYVEFSDIATVARTGDYDDLENKPDIPSKISDLTNDSDFVENTDLATVAFSGDYDDLNNKPNPVQLATMPTASSEYEGRIVQYIGATTLAYTSGYFYECVSDGELEPTYSWVQKNVQEESGASAELTESLTTAIAVGGIDAGTTYAAGTLLETMFRDMLVPTLYPTFTAPSVSVNNENTTVEVGTIMGGTEVVATFSRGAITPAYGTSGYRSGVATGYTLVTSGADEDISLTSENGRFNTPTWTRSTKGTVTGIATASYEAGEQPKDSKGNNYSTPLPAGSVSTSKTVTFILPYFYGVSNNSTISDFTGLTKSVSAKGNKTYNFTTNNQYMVFAYDSAYGNLKTILDGNGFDVTGGWQKSTVTVDGFSYYVYVSKSPTTDTNAPFTFKY